MFFFQERTNPADLLTQNDDVIEQDTSTDEAMEQNGDGEGGEEDGENQGGEPMEATDTEQRSEYADPKGSTGDRKQSFMKVGFVKLNAWTP